MANFNDEHNFLFFFENSYSYPINCANYFSVFLSCERKLDGGKAEEARDSLATMEAMEA